MAAENGSRKRLREISVEFLLTLCEDIQKHDWASVEHLLNDIEEGQTLPNVYCGDVWKHHTILHIAAGAEMPPLLTEKLLAVVVKGFCFQPDSEEWYTPLFIASSTAGYFESFVLLANAWPEHLTSESRKSEESSIRRVMTNISFLGNESFQDGLEHLLDLYPKAIHSCNRDSGNLLHLAITNAPAMIPSNRFGVIKMLLDKKPSMVLEKNSSGNIALHDSVKTDDKDSVDRAKLFIEIAGTDALRFRGDQGNTPLHSACFSPTRTMINILVTADASVLQMRNDNGLTPFECFQAHLYANVPTDSDWKQDTEKVEMALTLLAGKPVCLAGAPPLHTLLRDERANALVKVLFVSLLVDQCSKMDEQGDLPLHIVAGLEPPEETLQINHHLELLTVVLDEYPEACNIPNSVGLLPLGVMTRANYSWCNGLQLVFDNFPAAVEQLESDDLFTLLSNLGEEEEDGLQGIYAIVRAAPTLVRS